MLVLDGEAHRLGGFGRSARHRSRDSPTACSFVLPARTSSSAAASRPRQGLRRLGLRRPQGPEHNTVNCSVADLELTVEAPGRPARQLTLAGGAAYEFGMRETDHGIPIQPYPDG
jgi:hypothetical protein